ncbi:hypothetical protein V8C35DRAFT_308816 [Trichoderma chlorosporum]
MRCSIRPTPAPSSILFMPSYGRRRIAPESSLNEYPGGLEVKISLYSKQMERLKGDEEWNTFFSI